jgi:acyl-coenzyme A thioesterase PaaI-like protein
VRKTTIEGDHGQSAPEGADGLDGVRGHGAAGGHGRAGREGTAAEEVGASGQGDVGGQGTAADHGRDLAQARIPGKDAATGDRLLRSWRRLRDVPGGRWVFSRMVGRLAPYTGTIRAYVLELEPGRAVVTLRDRRRVRNHLRSVHAIALANLGELASGLAATAAMPPGVRGIPTFIQIEYRKKARGTLTATGSAALPPVTQPTTANVRADIVDGSGDVVACVLVTWTLERVS